MPNTDLDAAIRAIVAVEVDRNLLPYRDLLQRMADFMGVRPVRRGPGRPPKIAAGAVRGRRRGRPARGAGRGNAAAFKEGQPVTYKQGRGSFSAKVVKIDAATNTVTIERDKDGKKVVRPAAKVYAA